MCIVDKKMPVNTYYRITLLCCVTSAFVSVNFQMNSLFANRSGYYGAQLKSVRFANCVIASYYFVFVVSAS